MPAELPTADEPRPDRCETCRFWTREKAHDAFAGPAGYCHRFPPPHFRGEGYDFGDAGAWLTPTTMADDWCGEWKAKCPKKK